MSNLGFFKDWKPRKIYTEDVKLFCVMSFSALSCDKGNLTIADLRYGEKDIISPSTQIFAPIKG